MIVSWNWLATYLKLDIPVDVLTERLALAGLNHESTDEVGGDLAIDLEVTSNRPDCLGHLGVAREISVLFNKPFQVPDPRPKISGAPVETLTNVKIEAPDLCTRFTARVVTGAKIGPSPWWMAKRLETLGVRPISNVVDITNYVMFECGQPLHAYDLDTLAGKGLIVRKARAKEQLKAINGKTYELQPDQLVIADHEKPVGLAGVMGGLDTEISDKTQNILIEAAQFSSLSVRKTSRALALFSPSSYRFERPLDPEITEWASRRCAELILDLAGGTLHPGVIDLGEKPKPRPPVTLRLAQIERILGITIPGEDARRILRALGLEEVGGTPDAPIFVPPSWRSDLDREIDLIEDVARIHGYEHIPEDRAVPLISATRSPRERVEDEIRATLTGLGIDEAYTFSLVSESASIPLGGDGASASAPVRVEHASRKRESSLRQSLVPSLLQARRHNEAHGNPNADLFEIATVYLPRPGQVLPEQPTRLTIVHSGDFFAIKGIVEALLGRLHADAGLTALPATTTMLAQGRSAELLINGKSLGFVGEVSRATLDAFELREAASAAELDLGLLIEASGLVPQYHPLPPFPAVARDLSLVVPRSLAWADLSRVVGEVGGKTLESVVYLDAFHGGNIPADRQSLHFGLRFRHPERTLTGDEVEQAVKTIVDACASRFEATLR